LSSDIENNGVHPAGSLKRPACTPTPQCCIGVSQSGQAQHGNRSLGAGTRPPKAAFSRGARGTARIFSRCVAATENLLSGGGHRFRAGFSFSEGLRQLSARPRIKSRRQTAGARQEWSFHSNVDHPDIPLNSFGVAKNIRKKKKHKGSREDSCRAMLPQSMAKITTRSFSRTPTTRWGVVATTPAARWVCVEHNCGTAQDLWTQEERHSTDSPRTSFRDFAN